LKRQLAILAAALVFVAAGGVLIIKARHTVRPAAVPTTTIVVATRDIAPMQTLEQGALTTRTVPVGTVPGALTSMPYGSAARVPMVSGQVVMPNDIGPAVPSGDAVVGVDTTLAQSSGMLRPAQKVEIVSVIVQQGVAVQSDLGQGTVVAINSSQGAPVVSGSAQAAQGPRSAADNTQQAEVPAEVSLVVPQASMAKINAANAAGKIYLDIIP
jgi:Flp pilus assembly protein CpaB